MTPLDLASRYMEILFHSGNINELARLFSDHFTFRGPFFSFDSADDYLSSLKVGSAKGIQLQNDTGFRERVICVSALSVRQTRCVYPDGTVFRSAR